MSDLDGDIHARVQRALGSLSDAGKAVEPKPLSHEEATYHAANRHNSTALTTNETLDSISPEVLASITSKPSSAFEVPSALQDETALVQLQSSDLRFDEQLLPILQSIAAKHGQAALLLPDEGKAGTSSSASVPKFARPHRGDPPYEPAVMWARLTREELDTKAAGGVWPTADRTLPLPPYDVNKSFQESDIAAYPSQLEGWPQYGPNGVQRERSATGGRILTTGVEGGYKTVAQQWLEGPALGEPLGLYLDYKEELTRELAKAEAITARIRALQSSDPPPRTFQAQVLDRTRVDASSS